MIKLIGGEIPYTTIARLPRDSIPDQPQPIIWRGNTRQVTCAADAEYPFLRDGFVAAAKKPGLAIPA
ncbi:MAG: hypothetical protein ACFCVA_16105 [Gammaproteobacteria bacterium]